MISIVLVIFLIINILLVWQSTEYIIEFKRIWIFLPYLIFGVISMFVFALILNEIYNTVIWNIVQIISVINIFFMYYVIYLEVKK